MLSPRDQYGLFEPPTERLFSAGQWAGLIAPEDPDRVVLIIAASAGGRVSLRPVAAPAPASSGIPASPSLTFYHVTDAALVGAAWYAVEDPAVTGTVIQLTLRRWPRADSSDSAAVASPRRPVRADPLSPALARKKAR